MYAFISDIIDIDLVETVEDMEAYVQVDDEVIGHIMKMSPKVLKGSEDKESLLRKAKEILGRIEKRQIYRCLQSDPIDGKNPKLKVPISFLSIILEFHL